MGVKKPTEQTVVEFNLPMTREQADAIYEHGREAVIFVLLELAARIGKQAGGGPSVTTPSGMVPPYHKAAARGRKKKPGAKPGHAGKCRGRPPKITHHKEHPPQDRCPKCGSPLADPTEHRFRLIEDIPETQPEVTEHRIPRQWCPGCRKLVEPPVVDAMPGARFGHRLVALSAWLHYGLGTTLSQIIEVLQHHAQFELSQGGLMDAWERLAEVFAAWYAEIEAEIKESGVLHADETGWRVNGRTHWLWCFSTLRATCYIIDRSRGSPALSKFFTEAFDGTLVTDFWAAYSAVECAARQACLPHLFRELDKTDDADRTEAWAAFSKKLKRLLRDAIRLDERNGLSDDQFLSRRARLDPRLRDLFDAPTENTNVRRLQKRLRRYQDALFTFLDHSDVPSDNNHAEREIRPAVIMRKNSLANRSDNGARVQAILMSVYRTLKLRGHDPLDTIVTALRKYVRTGTLPPLPA
jgi:transposase